MISTVIRAMFVSSLKDKISLFYAVLFPLALLIGLGLYFDTPEYRFRLLTGVVVLSSLFWSVQGIAFQVHWQRNRGVYKLLKLTPFPTVSFILTMVLVRTALGVAINGIVMLAGMIGFGIAMPLGGIVPFLLILTLGMLCFTAMGFLLSNLARNEAQINMISNLIYIPMLFGTETFYSLQHAPQWIATAGNLFPLTYMVQGLRASFAGWNGTAFYMLIVAAFTVGLLALAALTFRWDAEQSIAQRKLPA
ncbi:ABC transporter permease [Paenibacillus sp. MSJ-34]|uniref:ABC transporter permease n=1 Tax=Paenibacillus sp. MSJ-34 TaxID=2841529 RepID=UPI001C11BDF3|nr:ABC transporter permease [Paenibacillus sp. MSJ-34]MBU5443721.1 ABC transporter permease [Paenibacillus sp. MSJ-34]